ncbi:hypothetical protein FYK55_10675 [Roseiconus nitratireducens]|uniref:Uncharacterized protein n=1 Tax=Roseiconus nitratireducens TaxID=2605748 RepID=A0A5M6D802_9BACT|nr:hypothetical protein [Roseiconus nitratireducens]KAA5543661.1 hypothetical protein FYK55_10675 [Roseiconus nitratireducens]
MAARDDSVIRGSLITCLILLVLSLALNFILWRWGDTQATQEQSKSDQLANAQNEIRSLEENAILYKAMLGIGQLSEDQYEALATSSSGDADLDQISTQFYRDMQVFGSDVGMQDRNYARLPEYFTNTIRLRNQSYSQARDEAAQIRTQAETDIDAARTAQQKAETERENLAKELADEQSQFATYRNDMLQKMEQAKDSKTKSERRLQELQRQAGSERNQLTQKAQLLENTIETQKLELNRLRSDRFENVQGEIRYVLRGGNIVSINLGSADALRPGITFGVIDRDETSRLQDANVKASIQVTKIRGPHLAEARVVAQPAIGNPIIEGDGVYSPFWAPGRTVRIALAGDIDIDGDDRPDNEALEGMIQAAGAEVAARVLPSGEIEGNLDAGVRFMVVGETPDLGGQNEEQAASEIAAIGVAKQKATELGVTVIPAWKLQEFLRTLDDSLTTPLGSAVRGEDFPPEAVPGPSRRRPVDLPKEFLEQRDNMQRNNEIVRP